ncbi:unnamed protein product [Urochloa humidicola]
MRRAHAAEIRRPRRAPSPRYADPASPPCSGPAPSRSRFHVVRWALGQRRDPASGVDLGLGAARRTDPGPGGSRWWWRCSTGAGWRCLGACWQSPSGTVRCRGVAGRAGTPSSYAGIISWLGRPNLAEAAALPWRSGWTRGEDGVGGRGSNARCADLGVPCPHTSLTTNMSRPPVMEVKRAANSGMASTAAEPLLATRITSQAYDSAHAFLFFCRVSIYRKVSH